MQCGGVCLVDAHEVSRTEACLPVSVARLHVFMEPAVKEPALQQVTVCSCSDSSQQSRVFKTMYGLGDASFRRRAVGVQPAALGDLSLLEVNKPSSIISHIFYYM